MIEGEWQPIESYAEHCRIFGGDYIAFGWRNDSTGGMERFVVGVGELIQTGPRCVHPATTPAEVVTMLRDVADAIEDRCK